MPPHIETKIASELVVTITGIFCKGEAIEAPISRFMEEEEENRSFLRIVSAFQQYQYFQAEWLIGKRNMYRMPVSDMRRIYPTGNVEEVRKTIFAHLNKLQRCVQDNQAFLNTVILPYDDLFPHEDSSEEPNPTKTHNSPDTCHAAAQLTAYHSEIEKVKSTLRQIGREWSVQGKPERDECYLPILEELARLFPDQVLRNNIRVLTPGCGLGRLPWEIAKMGFCSQGNEFSFYMLITSNAILNKSEKKEQHRIFPWIHSFCNLLSTDHQIQDCYFPDELPCLPRGSDFSMSAGDFLEVYTEENSWDCVVTCFFIDTAHNIIEYIECINRILVEGGVWINIGPLLYHWADMPGEQSVELSFEQVLHVIKSFGMEIQHSSTKRCNYTAHYKSMMNLVYESQFFVATKAAGKVEQPNPQ